MPVFARTLVCKAHQPVLDYSNSSRDIEDLCVYTTALKQKFGTRGKFVVVTAA